MTRVAAIGPEHRANLRQLKADFLEVFEAIEDPTDRSSPEFLAADALYRIWIKAIDEVALSLLDDIDAMEAGGPEVNYRASEILHAAESVVEDAMSNDPDYLSARDLIGTPEPESYDNDLWTAL